MKFKFNLKTLILTCLIVGEGDLFSSTPTIDAILEQLNNSSDSSSRTTITEVLKNYSPPLLSFFSFDAAFHKRSEKFNFIKSLVNEGLPKDIAIDVLLDIIKTSTSDYTNPTATASLHSEIIGLIQTFGETYHEAFLEATIHLAGSHLHAWQRISAIEILIENKVSPSVIIPLLDDIAKKGIAYNPNARSLKFMLIDEHSTKRAREETIRLRQQLITAQE